MRVTSNNLYSLPSQNWSWIKPKNKCESAALAAIGGLAWLHPVSAGCGLAMYLGCKRETIFLPRPVEQIDLPIPNARYHPRDLILAESKPIQVKLQNELDRAQAHMRAQSANPLLEKRARQKAKFKIEQHTEFLRTRKVGIAHAQGPRHEMEDAHIAALCTSQIDGKPLQYELFGVIDGHGGNETASFVAAHIKEEIERAISKHGISDSGIRKALKEACVQLDARAIQNVKHSGAVAVFTLKIGSQIWTANIGDSRAILKVGKRVIQLSDDAKPNAPRFKKSIEKRGGFVINVWGVPRVNGELAVARAFNDQSQLGADGHYTVSPKPKITKVDLNDYPKQPVYLIQACDGIWDVFSSSDVGALAGRGSAEEDAQRIVRAALNAKTHDNCSALVTSLS